MPQSKRHPARRPERRPSKPGHRNPQTAKAPAVAPATGWRRSLEKASARPLVTLSALPRLVVPLLLGVVLVLGLALHSRWAGLLLLVPAVFLTWLLLLSWPVISTSGKVLRILAVVAVTAAAVLRLAGVF